MQTIFPNLRYNDALVRVQSLCAKFGFIELFSVPSRGRVCGMRNRSWARTSSCWAPSERRNAW